MLLGVTCLALFYILPGVVEALQAPDRLLDLCDELVVLLQHSLRVENSQVRDKEVRGGSRGSTRPLL